jgi:hypothetical protein
MTEEEKRTVNRVDILARFLWRAAPTPRRAQSHRPPKAFGVESSR